MAFMVFLVGLARCSGRKPRKYTMTVGMMVLALICHCVWLAGVSIELLAALCPCHVDAHCGGGPQDLSSARIVTNLRALKSIPQAPSYLRVLVGVEIGVHFRWLWVAQVAKCHEVKGPQRNE